MMQPWTVQSTRLVERPLTARKCCICGHVMPPGTPQLRVFAREGDGDAGRPLVLYRHPECGTLESPDNEVAE